MAVAAAGLAVATDDGTIGKNLYNHTIYILLTKIRNLNLMQFGL